MIGIAAVALLCASLTSVAAASARPAAPAPALYSEVSALNQVAELLGRRSRPFGPRRSPSFSLLRFENRDGYVFSVVASRQTVALRVARRYGRGQRLRPALSTTYLAHGRATPTSITADFGARGRIALRFRPSGRGLRATRRAGCVQANGLPIARRGVFVGTLRFRGESGYTSARIHRARGGSIDLAALIACLIAGGGPNRTALPPSPTLPIDLRPFGIGARNYGPETPGAGTHPSDRPKRTILVSSDKLPVARTVFAAAKRDTGRPRFLAFEAESEGSIAVARLAFAPGGKADFSSDDSLSKAVVSPPAPFAGRAVFEHGLGDTKSWTGSLAVSFLGEPRLAVAGSPFEAQLIRSW
jgi:hypothetical protein